MKLKFTRKLKAVFSVYILGEPEITTTKKITVIDFSDQISLYICEKNQINNRQMVQTTIMKRLYHYINEIEDLGPKHRTVYSCVCECGTNITKKNHHH